MDAKQLMAETRDAYIDGVRSDLYIAIDEWDDAELVEAFSDAIQAMGLAPTWKCYHEAAATAGIGHSRNKRLQQMLLRSVSEYLGLKGADER